MTTPSVPIEQELLSHQAFLRRLAADLVGDEADDLVQDVWLRALACPPHHGLQLRAWLARVARNLAANRWRGEARRKQRDECTARERAQGDELEARLDLRQKLVGALDAVSPASREALLLRYFEGLPPREIARRLGIPVSTVKSRLQRGLAQMRDSLDADHACSRGAWSSAVLALGSPPAPTSALVLQGLVMGFKTKLAAVALLAAVGVYLAVQDPPAEPDANIAALMVDGVADEEPVKDSAALRPGDSPQASARRAPSVVEESAGQHANVAGRVLRVVLEGMEEDRASHATVTAVGRGVEAGWDELVEASWRSTGRTSEYDLEPFFARVAARFTGLRDGDFAVEVDHPLHFRKRVQVPLAGGVEDEHGRTVYEVRVQLDPPALWPEFTLSVRDARTHEHLEDVELRCVTTALMGVGERPGGLPFFSRLGDDFRSPLSLQGGHEADDPERRVAGLALRRASGKRRELATLSHNGRPLPERGLTVFARAPGYAWGRVIIDLSEGGDRELLLSPGARLGVRLANAQLERYAELGLKPTLTVGRVEPDGSEGLIWQQDVDEALVAGGLQLEGLEPGDIAVRFELSPSWRRKSTALAREELYLGAGEEREVLVTLADPPEPPALANLGGVISLPSFGGEDEVRLEFFRSDYRYGDPDHVLSLAELEPVSAVLPTWSFHLEDMPVGRYQVRLLPFLKSWMIDLPVGGRDDVELVIPELAEVLVETVEARTGERAPLEALAYRELEVLPDQVTHGGTGPWFSVAFEGEPGRFRLWMPPGQVALRPRNSTNGVDYSVHSEQFELVPGLQSLRLELTRACRLRFEFRVDGAALPHEDPVFVGLSRRIRAVGHDGRVGGMYPYSLLEASAPGLYEITFEGVGADRFLPIPRRRVEVTAGETTDVIVELRRK